jgi:hypothetical protein
MFLMQDCNFEVYFAKVPYKFHLQVYVDSGRPHAVNTAWSMLALIYSGQVRYCPLELYSCYSMYFQYNKLFAVTLCHLF